MRLLLPHRPWLLTFLHSRRLPQEPRLQGLVACRGIQPGHPHTRGGEGRLPQSPRPCPRRLPATSAHTAHSYPPKDTRIRFPRQMARLPRHHCTTAERGKHRISLRRCPVPAGDMQDLQIQVGREPGGLRQDRRHDIPPAAQHR